MTNPLVPRTTPELKVSKCGAVVVDERTMQTSIPRVYAGGDIVVGAATVILAMGQAKVAARSIDHFLMTGRNPEPEPQPAAAV